ARLPARAELDRRVAGERRTDRGAFLEGGDEEQRGQQDGVHRWSWRRCAPARFPLRMRKVYGLLPSALLLGGLAGCAAPADVVASAPRAPKCLLVFVDGFIPDALDTADTPNLHRLLARAAWSR